MNRETAQTLMDELCIREAVLAYASHYSYKAIAERHGVGMNTPFHVWKGNVAYSAKLQKRRYRVIVEPAD